jgi:3-deoxy-D-manno-octulosonate 8-phosphate phosphatase (KDO 8-P phosphatase)
MALPKLVITDIDGVWTDGGMYYTADGDVMKRFSVIKMAGVCFSSVNLVFRLPL